ncbi:MAG TPA: DUF433 domain-containing protein [Chitinophagaceae bacterium]|nr:DUF433 domain-containing protein [Chitinophagaceae bacterium]
MWTEYIEQKSGVLGGKPIIKGTRIAVDLILEKIGAGESIDDLVLAYPHITREQLLACISYGAAVIRNETIIEV